jgi:hypothetical protein
MITSGGLTMARPPYGEKLQDIDAARALGRLCQRRGERRRVRDVRGEPSAVTPVSAGRAVRASRLPLLREIRATTKPWLPKTFGDRQTRSGSGSDDGDGGHATTPRDSGQRKDTWSQVACQVMTRGCGYSPLNGGAASGKQSSIRYDGTGVRSSVPPTLRALLLVTIRPDR